MNGSRQLSSNKYLHKLYNPKIKRVLISRDVLIDESKGQDCTATTTNSNERNVIMHLDNEDSAMENVESIDIQLRKSQRERQASQALIDYEVYSGTTISAKRELVHFALRAESKPVSQEEASQSAHWRDAMEEELKSIEKIETQELVDFPKGKTPIDVKWVYKTKMKPNGEDYNKVFASVARLDTLKLIIAVASYRNWSIYQLDVKSTFLNGPLQEEVYITQPPGYAVIG